MIHTDSTPKGEASHSQEDFERRITRLKALNSVVQLALPVAAASAGVAAVVVTPVFPIAAAVGAVIVAASEAFVRRERKKLQADLKELEKRGDVDSDKLAELSSEANRLTVNGPSS